MKPLTLASLLAPLITGVAALPKQEEAVSYNGYKVYRINTLGGAAAIQDKLAALSSYEQWHQDVGHLDVLISPDEAVSFEGLGLDFRVMHQDLGTSISAESAASAKRWTKRQDNPLAWFETYHNYEDHIQYFRDLHDAFPSNSEMVSSGKSYQGRDIFGIHLWGAGGPGKPAVLYHGTVHAREWISAPVVEYITLQLINGYNAGNNQTRSFLDRYDYYIFPFVNPDGFLYTQTTDRLWRKNRQPPPAGSPNMTCLGRDINRNWEHGWDANPRGSSTNPCSQTYRGAKPGDAPENAGLDGYLRRIRDAQGIKLFVDWHSYGQYLLFPFGYAETLYAPEQGRWTKASSLISEAVRDSSDAGTTYTFGASGATLYATSGSAPDHAYAIGRAEWSFTIELRDTGRFGFVLPPDQIRPAAEEMWAGQKVLFSLLDETFFDGVGAAQLYDSVAVGVAAS
ncbi:hypothetical protein PG999_003245 [Apiospora kogelbergensis]|uniref:Peptidase M14 domain-containing protein n=1 Tax=Apiospora kogelbergensis TaxID=1337665 RepID=A0AAW0R331_9PEZI